MYHSTAAQRKTSRGLAYVSLGQHFMFRVVVSFIQDNVRNRYHPPDGVEYPPNSINNTNC